MTKVFDVLSAPCNSQGTLKDKQLAKLRESIESMITRQDQKRKTLLKRPEDVQFSHYNALLSFLNLFKSVVDVLEIIEQDGSYGDQTTAASILLDDIYNFEFAFSLQLIRVSKNKLQKLR